MSPRAILFYFEAPERFKMGIKCAGVVLDAL